jgi:hypothetical protein
MKPQFTIGRKFGFSYSSLLVLLAVLSYATLTATGAMKEMFDRSADNTAQAMPRASVVDAAKSGSDAEVSVRSTSCEPGSGSGECFRLPHGAPPSSGAGTLRGRKFPPMSAPVH